ncbi:MAG TPA: TonB-dependent receptor [Chitinophagaceae bacterium]|nr:TonB-dependent receptor [Chitinophagaceae bacterium]
MRKLSGILLTIAILSWQLAVAQNREVTGKIVDSKDNSPLAGVTIKAKGSTANAVSGADGSFRISVPASANTLQISYVGYGDIEIAIGSSPLTVTMTAGDKSLSEVIVVGYGTKIKRDVTSSIAKVSNKEFQNLPLPSFEQALQGRAAGVFINSGSGKLGQGMKIRVRGISSISASQQPFVVIDGVPAITTALGSYTEPDNPLATLNPDDIESIEVLKDAASSAIYGARASNGVILVTTKSGKVGKTKINLGVFNGWSTPTKKGEFLSSAQYKQLFTAASENMGYDAEEEFAGNTGTDDWNSTNDSKWSDQAFQDGGIAQYNLSIAGGDTRTKFLVSGSWNDQKGIILDNSLNRLNGRINLDHTVSSRLRLGANLSLAKSENHRVSSDNAFTNPLQINALPPLHPIYNADGTANPATLYYNYLIDHEHASRNATTYRSISNIYGELNVLSNLVFRSQVGIDWINLQEEEYLGRETLDGAPLGAGYNGQVTSTVVTYTNTLSYRNTFGDRHNFDAVGGIEYQKGNTSELNATGKGFPSNSFTKLVSATDIEDANSSGTRYAFASYFARANYKLDDKYLFGISARMDGSSRFGTDNKYGFFPAVSAGWILSEESFLNSSRTISYLKLRASYGKTGNAEIGNFSSRSLVEATDYANTPGLVTTQIGVNDLSWESTKQLDIGLDFGLFDNRLSGEIDYFNKKTTDLLLAAPIPAILGFTTITKNIGAMNNHGWELVLNGAILRGGDLGWTASVNLSTYKNEVTKLFSPVSPSSRSLGRLAVGQPFGQFYGRMYAGVDANNGDALYYKADGTTTNDYSQAVDTILGNPNPDFYGGFNNHFTYKGFDLDIQCQFVKGGDLYNIAGFFQSVNGDYFDNQTVDQMNYWQKPGDVTSIPQPRLYEGNGAGKSSRWVQDGSYFRIKSINLGYNIPRRLLTKLRIDNARVYLAGTNLVTLTKYVGYDPEINTTYTGDINLGHDFYTPPQAKTISIGINVGF